MKLIKKSSLIFSMLLFVLGLQGYSQSNEKSLILEDVDSLTNARLVEHYKKDVLAKEFLKVWQVDSLSFKKIDNQALAKKIAGYMTKSRTKVSGAITKDSLLMRMEKNQVLFEFATVDGSQYKVIINEIYNPESDTYSSVDRKNGDIYVFCHVDGSQFTFGLNITKKGIYGSMVMPNPKKEIDIFPIKEGYILFREKTQKSTKTQGEKD